MFNELTRLLISGATKPVILYIVIASFADIIMGLIKAGIGKQFNSTISSGGLLKHVAMIAVPIITSPLFDLIKSGHTYWTAFTYLILITMILSIIENWVACGLPFPQSIVKYLDDSKTKLVKPQAVADLQKTVGEITEITEITEKDSGGAKNEVKK